MRQERLSNGSSNRNGIVKQERMRETPGRISSIRSMGDRRAGMGMESVEEVPVTEGGKQESLRALALRRQVTMGRWLRARRCVHS